ncbi:MAG: Imm5 family immunity protein [Candidatus Omnitrophica bacterium]|nr:Imm5 family immunity protein [Candidatus Omnitrophota bacterium]
MRINKLWLKKWNACDEGKDWFLLRKFKSDKQVMEELLADKKENWANWVIIKLFNRKQKIQYAIFAAEQVINLYEEKYPNDKRPREAIEAAKAYLNKPTQKNKDAAADAAYAAYAAADAAYAAHAAAYAAHAAAYAAHAAAYAADAAYVAHAAAYAADAAYVADAAAYAAAYAEMKTKIIRYGVGLLK